MTQEALKMALYYLEQSDNYLGSLDHSKPIAVIKEALAQPSPTAGYAAKIESLIAERDGLAHEIQKLQIALAFWLPNVPSNDSKFAERCANDAYLLVGCEGEIEPSAQKLGWIKTQPEQEPVATVTSEAGNPDVRMSWWHEPALPVGTKVYTTPPQRTFVGLTGEEAMDVTRKEGHELLDFIYEYGTGSEGVEERIVAICKAIEAKLKEKNT